MADNQHLLKNNIKKVFFQAIKANFSKFDIENQGDETFTEMKVNYVDQINILKSFFQSLQLFSDLDKQTYSNLTENICTKDDESPNEFLDRLYERL